MTTYLLAGGGTAGHVNPLLATADTITDRDPTATVLVLGTAEGLEARLVPQRGYELITIPKLPFPRRPNRAALLFPGALRSLNASVVDVIRERGVDVVAGFGGYAAAPAYMAARAARVPFAVHEANARPGLANRLGARMTRFVGVTFPGTALAHGRLVGLPLRREIERLDRKSARERAWDEFGLEPDRPVLLVTGGSLGAQRINQTVRASVDELLSTGFQVLHITGNRDASSGERVVRPGYHALAYCDSMHLALAVADVAIARSGAATVCEFAAVGVPAVFVPYAVGNGEQRLNAQGLVEAGGARIISDRDFTPDAVRRVVVPLLTDSAGLGRMRDAAYSVGVRDGSERMADLIAQALAAGRP